MTADSELEHPTAAAMNDADRIENRERALDGPSARARLAETLFLECVARDGDFEALCAAHADLADELRRVQVLFDYGRAVLGSASAPAASDQQALEHSAEPRYSERGTIAVGGMGAVVEVFDRKLMRPVAMKLVRPTQPGEVRGAAGTARRRARLVSEARILAQLEHPSILPIYDFDLDAVAEPFFTMLRVRGHELEEAMRAASEGRGEWTQRRVLDVLVRVCEAVAHAHSRGIVHRDLKPANVMVGSFGEVFVMDWGVARSTAPIESADAPTIEGERAGDPNEHVESAYRSPELTFEGDVLGTPAYMAPEQARGRNSAVGPAADIYALGAMLYRLLAGHPPYLEAGAKRDTTTTLARVLSGPPRRLRELIGPEPHELIAIAEKAMQREPLARYRNVAELLEDLRAYSEDRAGSAWSDSWSRRAVKWVRRHPARAVGVFTTALLVAISSLGLTRMESLAAERSTLRARTNEHALSRDVVRLREYETSSEDDSIRRMLYFEAAALECADALQRVGLDLDGPLSIEALVRGMASDLSPNAQDDVSLVVYSLLRYLGQSGLAQASEAARGQPVRGERGSWLRMAAEHPRAVRLWPRVLELAEALPDRTLGARSAQHYARWLVDGAAPVELELADLPSATRGERELASFVVQNARGVQAARGLFEATVRDFPDSAWSHLQLSVIEAAEGRYERVLAHAMASVAAWPESALAHNNLGVALSRLRRKEEAVLAYQRACDLMRHDVRTRMNVASQLAAAGRSSEALDYLEGVEPPAHAAADFWRFRGLALRNLYEDHGSDLGLLDAARESLLHASELEPASSEIWLWLGAALEWSEDIAGAQAAYDRGLALRPDGPDLLLGKASVLGTLGSHCEAVELALGVARRYPAASLPRELAQFFLATLDDADQRERFEAEFAALARE